MSYYENAGNLYALVADGDKGLKIIYIKIANLYRNYIYAMSQG